MTHIITHAIRSCVVKEASHRPEARNSVRRSETAATAAESPPNEALVPLVKSPILTPAKLAGKRMAKAVLGFARRLAMYEAYQQAGNVV